MHRGVAELVKLHAENSILQYGLQCLLKKVEFQSAFYVAITVLKSASFLIQVGKAAPVSDHCDLVNSLASV